jgi:hypothetical protein
VSPSIRASQVRNYELTSTLTNIIGRGEEFHDIKVWGLDRFNHFEKQP